MGIKTHTAIDITVEKRLHVSFSLKAEHTQSFITPLHIPFFGHKKRGILKIKNIIEKSDDGRLDYQLYLP